MERGRATFKGYTADEIIGKHSLFYTAEDQKTGLPRRALETAAKEGRFEQEGCRPEMSRVNLGEERYRRTVIAAGSAGCRRP